MRQRLQSIVKVDTGQRCREAPILLAHAHRIDDEQRRAVAGHQMLDRLVGERVLRRVQFQGFNRGGARTQRRFGH